MLAECDRTKLDGAIAVVPDLEPSGEELVDLTNAPELADGGLDWPGP